MTIERVHLVYPHGPRASTPDAIGRELGKRLGWDLEVVFHDWAAFERIPSSSSAALVGHAHPVPGTTFRRSARQDGWGRRVLLQPFVTELDQIGYIAGVLPHVDHFVAIAGAHWERLLARSPFASISSSFTRIDLAVLADDFPFVVTADNPPGKRKLVYIGRDVPMKNLDYLEQIAARRPEWTFASIGPRGASRAALQQLGPMDFRDPQALDLLAEFDVFITVGRADANPTTVLEAMAWGLLPVCTPESGYEGYEGIINIPLGDIDAAVAVLDQVQAMPSDKLAGLRVANRRRIEDNFTWDRFSRAVRSVLDGANEDVRGMRLPWSQRWLATARWWATAPAASNRAGLSDAARTLTAQLRR